jgi:peptidoglycan/xylan/chitin deacetylase (PgdA/CDA1 family)
MKVSVADKTITTSNGSTIINQVIIKNNVAYVPIRLVGEFFGFKVEYLSQYKIVRVYNGNHKYSHQAFYYSNRKAIENYFYIAQGKIIYLTFDDGPNAYTSKVLDILKNKNAHGTFFMIEGNIRRFPQVAKRIIQEGNYPGLHSVSHDKNKLYMGKAQNVALEMEKTRKTLLSVTGFNSHMTRVPYGSKPYMLKSYRDYMAKYSFKMWDWSIDTEDWRYQKSNPRKIVSNVKSGIERLKNSKGPIVVLFHDTKGTVSVLPEIIDYLRQKGYQPAAYNPEQHAVVNFWKDSRL